MPKFAFITLAALALGAASCAPGPQLEAAPPGGLEARVTRISEEFANINTDLSGETLARYGVVLEKPFSVRFKGRTVRAVLCKDYGDVPRGDWVGLIETDGTLQVAISFGHAATELGVKAGDRVYIEPAASD